MKKISVITCFYEGNKYMEKLCRMIDRNKKKISSRNVDVEFIIVNDSPWEPVQLPDDCKMGEIRIVKNVENKGIHFSRVRGINCANGDYIVILDQDDEITDDFLISQYSKIGDNDIIVCNGVKETYKGKKIIYKDQIKMHLVNVPLIYLKAANQIVSPGQCMIKKDSFPDEWMHNLLKNNGSDDLFLWLIYLKKGTKFVLNSDVLYCHKQVGDNLSNDLQKMCLSDIEMCNIAKENAILPNQLSLIHI